MNGRLIQLELVSTGKPAVLAGSEWQFELRLALENDVRWLNVITIEAPDLNTATELVAERLGNVLKRGTPW